MGEGAKVMRLTVSPDFEEVGVARRFVRQALVGAPPSVSDDMQLVVSELITNAITHGAAEPVEVELRMSPAVVTLAVESHGFVDRLPALDDWTMANAAAHGGRGLAIVRQLADEVRIQRGANAVTIVVDRSLGLTGGA